VAGVYILLWPANVYAFGLGVKWRETIIYRTYSFPCPQFFSPAFIMPQRLVVCVLLPPPRSSLVHICCHDAPFWEQTAFILYFFRFVLFLLVRFIPATGSQDLHKHRRVHGLRDVRPSLWTDGLAQSPLRGVRGGHEEHPGRVSGDGHSGQTGPNRARLLMKQSLRCNTGIRNHVGDCDSYHFHSWLKREQNNTRHTNNRHLECYNAVHLFVSILNRFLNNRFLSLSVARL